MWGGTGDMPIGSVHTQFTNFLWQPVDALNWVLFKLITENNSWTESFYFICSLPFSLILKADDTTY